MDIVEYNPNASVNSVVGIDLGTTYSVVGVYQKDGKMKVIADDYGQKLIPSVVAFSTDGKEYVGRDASENMDIEANQVVSEAKRLIGRRFDEPAVQENVKRWPFHVTADKDGKAQVTVSLDGKHEFNISPSEISAKVLKKLKSMAEKYLNTEVKDVVITVPTVFNNLQRKATEEAAELAGLNVIRFINEPSAAVLAYGEKLQSPERRNVLVADVGGGTSDVAVIKIEREKYEVITSKGDCNLGGEDFDTNLVNHCLKQIKNIHGIDARNVDPKAMRRLRSQCEFVKCKLSEDNDEYVLELDNFVHSTDITLSISRKVFEELNQRLFDKAIGLVPACLDAAQMKFDDIHHVVLVGGSTKIPKLRVMIKDLFEEDKIYEHINPDEAIAIGATVFSAQKMKIYDGYFILTDVIPFSLGLKANQLGEMIVMIPQNSTLPIQKTKLFTPKDDYQREAAILVYQGENPYVKDNTLLGEFKITRLESDLSYNVKIEVTFSLDENNILTVTAKEVATGGERKEEINIIYTSQIESATSLR